MQFIEKLRSLAQTAQHALSSEDVNTMFFKITNLYLMHKEFVCELQSALGDDRTACDIVVGPVFHKLVSITTPSDRVPNFLKHPKVMLV